MCNVGVDGGVDVFETLGADDAVDAFEALETGGGVYTRLATIPDGAAVGNENVTRNDLRATAAFGVFIIPPYVRRRCTLVDGFFNKRVSCPTSRAIFTIASSPNPFGYNDRALLRVTKCDKMDQI